MSDIEGKLLVIESKDKYRVFFNGELNDENSFNLITTLMSIRDTILENRNNQCVGFGEINEEEQECSVNNETIYLHLTSYGGKIDIGLQVFDTIQFIQQDVKMICIGERVVGSSSILLLLGCKERYCYPNCSIMLHDLYYSGFNETLSTLKEFFKNSENLNKRIVSIYSKQTGLSTAKVKKLLEEEPVLSQQEAFEHNIINNILPLN